MEIKYKNSEESMKKFYRYIYERIDILKYYKTIMLLICIPISVFIFFAWDPLEVIIYKGISTRDKKVIVVLFIMCIAWIILVNKVFKKGKINTINNNISYIDCNYEDEITITIEDEKISVNNGKVLEEYCFDYIKGIKKIGQYINIRVKNGKIIMIPSEEIDKQTGKEIDDFVKELKMKIKR